ncbi:MAG TPA: CsbD family protein [Hyphomicrobiales bacterium]|nr:CsbD family protein [Hyphomicrobiales bacterium]
MTNKDILDGKWKQMKGQVKQKWGKLTDDELDRVDGRAEELAGLLQERYGLAREEAKKQLKDMADSV